jgi:hypothetical protein
MIDLPMKSKKLLFTFAIFLMSSGIILAQEKADTLKKQSKKQVTPLLKPIHRNTIKFNPTPMLLFGEVRNLTFSYERMIKDDQSVAVQVGYLLFPKLLDDTIANIIKLTSRFKQGINLSFDYRWYPGSRNRRPAPDGVYIGAYASYYGFKFQNNFDILQASFDENGAIDGKINFINVGASLGYQFIFWKRLTLDLLLFGPSISVISHDVKITGSLDTDQIGEIDQEIVDAVKERFPGVVTILSGETLSYTGSKTEFGVGFRYSISIGFHF